MAQSNGGQQRTAAGLQRSQQFQSNSSLSSIKSLKAPSVLSRHAKRVTFSQKTLRDSEQNTELAACLTTSQADVRLSAGENDPAKRKVTGLARTNSECQVMPPGMDYQTGEAPKLAEFEIKIDNKGCPKRHLQQMCHFSAYEDRRRFKNKGTQSMYRESSAQTLAYLPEIADKAQAEHLELFTLPNLLDGNKPPGVYEVEILERTRKRVAFKAAVKTNLKQQLQEKRELAMQTKYKAIFKAFEWERWIEREEHIQLCQMARLEIVIKMFDRREREMHEASRRRIEAACQRIEERRLKGLRKNELIYQRGMRRLKAQCEKKTLHWIKETPVRALGSRCSEHYAPLLRHGVDPARQHFAKIRKQREFDMHIEELDKRIKMGNLECPFAKLNYWSKPKPPQQEYEQNFCTDKNLQNLYESLVRLREESEIPKTHPKCLKKRKRVVRNTIVDPVHESLSSKKQSLESVEKSTTDYQSQGELTKKPQQLNTDNVAKELLLDRRQFDLENTMHKHEGSCIGYILHFLNDEMDRLEEQRRLHYLVIMAQQERWRREAAEAGLRQKENEIRHLYDELFQQGSLVNETEEYVKDILTTDVAHIAEEQALEAVLEMARKVDIDVQRWLESFKLIQTPLSYHTLRDALRKMVCPNFEELVLLYEKKVIAEYIIEDVLFDNIWQALEPFDISSTLTSDLLDRLIDNDLYLFSTDSEDDDDLRKSYMEAKAIIRKLIRQAVPGRRWKTEIERIAHENYLDLLDNVFNDILSSTSLAELLPCEPNPIHSILECTALPSNYNLEPKSSLAEPKFSELSLVIKQQLLNIIRRIRKDKITGDLKNTDNKFDEDEMDTERDTLLDIQTFREPGSGRFTRPAVFGVQSTIDFKNEPDFKSLKVTAVKIKVPHDGILSLAEEDANLNEEEEVCVEGMAYEADDEQSIKGTVVVVPTNAETNDNVVPTNAKTIEPADSYVSNSKFNKEVPENLNEMILKVAVERKQSVERTNSILRKSAINDIENDQTDGLPNGTQSEQKVRVTGVTKEQVIDVEAGVNASRPQASVSLLGSVGSVTYAQLVNNASSYFDKKLTAMQTENQDDERGLGAIVNIATSSIDLPVTPKNDSPLLVRNKAKRE